MINKGTRVVFFILLISYFISARTALAQYGTYGSYGYGSSTPSQSITIDKKVGRATVQTKGGTTQIDFVDNLSSSDIRFQPGQDIWFQLNVKNTSDNTLSDVVLKDFLPAYVTPIELGTGSYDSGSRVITITIPSLGSQEEKRFTIRVRVVSQENLPANQGVLCLVNRSQAFNSQTSDEDSSQFCIEKTVVNVKAQPHAGPEMGLALLALQLGGLTTGLYIKKRVS